MHADESPGAQYLEAVERLAREAGFPVGVYPEIIASGGKSATSLRNAAGGRGVRGSRG